MSPNITSEAFRRATDPLLQVLDRRVAHDIADFHADEQLQARIEALAIKANEGDLSEDERSEYAGYVQANHFIAALQAQARRRLM